MPKQTWLVTFAESEMQYSISLMKLCMQYILERSVNE